MGLCLIQAGLVGRGRGGDSTWVDQAGHRVVFLRRVWVSHVYPRCYARVRLSWGGDWNEHGHGRWARGSGMGSDAGRKVEKELKPE